MELTVSRKIYIGSGDNGRRLMNAIQEKADKLFNGNVSRALIWTFCEKHGIDPRTGEPAKTKTKCSD
jgi:hypothetical protein